MLKERKKDLILEAKISRKYSPEYRIKASLELLELAEELYKAANIDKEK